MKIERAKEHIGQLETEIARFMARNPYGTVPYGDVAGGQQGIRARR
ncbi:MAG: hypothetical protein HYX89_01365 [Chloroflexi bacterium]|nr:hypothetical protein [Chloroflexota bacterium]